jgi:arylsulfatase A-like enzyme
MKYAPLLVGLLLISLVEGQNQYGPNIILFFVDDMGYGDAGVYGQQMFTTPNIDLMAAEGILFTDFYAAATVCAPSRGSVMQGLHTGHGRIKGNDATYLQDSDVTIAEVLKFGGYHTGCIGKWGVGEFSPIDNPQVQGMDYFYGYVWNYHAHNFYPEFIVKNGEKIPLDNVCAVNCGVSGNVDDGKGVAVDVHNDYVPHLLSREAADFIKRNYANENPFFLHYAPNIPHTNNEGGYDGHGQEVPDYGEFAAESWPPVEQGFAQMMRYIDNDVGMIMYLLDSLGIADKTLMIFTSDNGPHQEGGHTMEFFDSNGDLRGMKRDLWDGGVRVPMIARWPRVIAANSVTDYVGYSPDFMPTFAELAGVTVPEPIDGISLVPTLLGNSQGQQEHEYLYWEHNNNPAVRYQQWKLVQGALYDLENDLGEQNDVASANPDIVTLMQGFIDQANVDPPANVTWDSQRVTPTKIRGCMDPARPEYDPVVFIHDSSLCNYPPPPSIKDRGRALDRLLSFRAGTGDLIVTASRAFKVSLYNSRGCKVWERSGQGSREFDMDITERGLFHVLLKTEGRVFQKYMVILE